MSQIPASIDGPVFQFEDHDELYAQFTVVVTGGDDGQTIARIDVPTPKGVTTFEARHTSRLQAVADVEAAVDQARKTGKLITGVF